MIIIIAAAGESGTIGIAGKLPWGKPIPADMKHFREHTLGNVVAMGRKTWESIGSKPLPCRENIVMTRDSSFVAHGANVVTSIAPILELAKEHDVYIIGGAEIYAAFLPYATKIHITVVGGSFLGDTFFPSFDEDEWKKISTVTPPENNTSRYPVCFMEYKRISPIA